MKKGLLLVVCCIFCLAALLSACSPQNTYDEGLSFMRAGEFGKAQEAFARITDFEDSAALVKECEDEIAYAQAKELLSKQEFEEALEVFKSITKGFKDVDTLLIDTEKESAYAKGKALLAEQKLEDAAQVFKTILNFKDVNELYAGCSDAAKYEVAKILFDGEDYEAAQKKFTELGEYEDASYMAYQCDYRIQSEKDYQKAVAALEAGDFLEAYALFYPLLNYKDSEDKLKICGQTMYDEGVKLLSEGNKVGAYHIFSQISGYEDSYEKRSECAVEMPKSGILEKNISGGVSVTIKCPKDDNANYIKIYKQDGTLAQTLFIRPGGKGTAKLPAGTYKMNAAYGTEWFGDELMFGNSGIYYVMRFSDAPDGSMIISSKYNYTIEMRKGVGGNVGSDLVGAENF